MPPPATTPSTSAVPTAVAPGQLPIQVQIRVAAVRIALEDQRTPGLWIDAFCNVAGELEAKGVSTEVQDNLLYYLNYYYKNIKKRPAKQEMPKKIAIPSAALALHAPDFLHMFQINKGRGMVDSEFEAW